MKKSCKLLSAVLLLSLLCGCATSTMSWRQGEAKQLSSNGREVLYNLRGMNSGLFLFYCIPLWSGTPGKPNRHEYVTFENRVKPGDIHRMFESRLPQMKADLIEDVVTQESSVGWWSLGILWKRTVRGSAVAVKDAKPKR